MASEASETGLQDLHHPYLQALLAAGVSVDQLLPEAESLGFTPDQLLQVADQLLGRARDGSAVASLFLALATARDWRPFVPEALRLGIRLLEPLIHAQCSDLDVLARRLSEDDWDELCTEALRRLDYPSHPWHSVHGASALARALPWLEQDLPLVLNELELSAFASQARVWSQMVVEALVLRDGSGPRRLVHAPGESWYRPDAERSTRLFRVGRLRALEGLRHAASLVAVSCPDLESLDAAPPLLVLKDCPGLTRLPSHPRSRLLHLEDCAQLRTLGAAQVRGDLASRVVAPTYQTVVLAGCGALRELPSTMNVTGHMLLRAMGPLERWPEDFRIGGDLRLKDCPALEELPVLEVRGCLRVEGASGLRRLAPGTVIGRHLDLRACAKLEGVPRGVKVGGVMYLPAHLQRPVEVFEAPEPLLEAPVDHYPILRTLLLGLSFPDLARPVERLLSREQAQAALEALRVELREDPRIETELLWTASEVWRDLAEELWAEEHPWSSDRNEADDDLPLAWFRGLLLAA